MGSLFDLGDIPETYYVDGVTAGEGGQISLVLKHKLNSDYTTVQYLLKITVTSDELDVGETARTANRIGWNDPRTVDSDGVSGEDDLIALKIHKLEPAGLSGMTYKLHFSDSKISVWQQNNKTQAVISDTTTFSVASDTTVYVEGTSPSSSMDGEVVTLRVYKDATLICEDKVKLIVAEMMFGLFGDGGGGEATLRSYANAQKKDLRTDPYIIKTATACYSLYIWNTEKFAKIALGAENGYVAYDGHSNFGIGFAFSAGMTSISDFMNVGNELSSLDWIYMRDGQGHPNLSIAYSEYGDDPATTNLYDPWLFDKTYQGDLGNYTNFYATSSSSGNLQMPLITDSTTPQYKDYHYNVAGVTNIIVKAGALDMPSKNWNKLFLNSCSSGEYYYDTFDHGTLIFTHKTCSNAVTTKVFFEGIVEEKSNSDILIDLNDREDVNDYHQF